MHSGASRYAGTTSMELGIKVITENIQTQTVCHANSCFFTMVAVNEERKATAVPPDEERRFVAAHARKELRRQ